MLLAALTLALGFQQALPKYEIGGETVRVQIPTWKSEAPRETYELNGWTYGFEDGRLIGRTRTGWGWSDAYPAIAADATVEPILFNVTRVIDEDLPGTIPRQRTGEIYTDDYRPLKREIALFCHLVAQKTEGRTRIEPTWRVDEQMYLVDDAFRWAKYLSPHVNATAEKPSAGLGPFATSFILSAGFGREISIERLDGRPIIAIPVYDYFDRARPGQLARAMLNAWLTSQTPDAKAGQRLPLFASFLDAATPLHEEASEEGWETLPKWTDEQVAARLGGRRFTANVAERTWLLVGDNPGVYPLTRDEGQGGVLLSGPSGSLVAVRRGFAALYASKLGQPLASALFWGEPFTLFEAKDLKPTTRDVALLGIQPKVEDTPEGSHEISFGPGEAEGLLATGGFTASTAADPERGSVGEIRELAVRRKGWVRLLGRFDPAKTPFLEFSIKPRGRTWPVNLVVVGDGWRDVYRLFGSMKSLPKAPPLYSEEGAVDLDVKTEPSWQRVIVDLKRAKGQALGLYLSVPSQGTSITMPRGGTPTLLLDDLAVKTEPSGPVTPTVPTPAEESPSATAKDPEARAAFAQSTGDVDALLTLLKDPSDLVLRSVAERFRELKSPKAIPDLTLLGRSLSPRVARAAAQALGAQGSETSIAALRYNFQHALGDYLREFAADAMPAIEERRILADLSIALHFRRPQARIAAVKALARQPFKEASLVMLTFLNDEDPTVRLAVIQALPTKDDTVLKRLIGEARSDPSDDVRAAAFRKLREWGAPEASEAAKDPSPRVRGG